MNLTQKLQNLQRSEPVVLYRWTAGRKRIAGDYVLLSNMRLNALICNHGTVRLALAAPVLTMSMHRPRVVFKDSDVLTITEGTRMGINITGGSLRDDEKAMETPYCFNKVIDSDKQSKLVTDKIMSLGCSPYYPVSRVLVPEMFRITRRPETLKPVFNADMMRVIKGPRKDTMEDLLRKFHSHLDMFGTFTDDGYIIPYEYVATGGCVICAAKGIAVKTGSAVHSIPWCLFNEEMIRLGWSIETGKEKEDELERIAGCSDSEECGVSVDSDDGTGRG